MEQPARRYRLMPSINLNDHLALARSRYGLRFQGGIAAAWIISRNSEFVVAAYSLAAYGPIAGELALKRLRQLQRWEHEARR